MHQTNDITLREPARRGVAVAVARLVFVVGAGLVTVLSLVPASALPPLGMWDKLQHAVAYALLAVAGCTGFSSTRGRRWVLIALAVYGGSIELIQSALSAREGSIADWIANAIGIGFGYIVARIAGNAMRRSGPT